jgi:hypothetical protein
MVSTCSTVSIFVERCVVCVTVWSVWLCGTVWLCVFIFILNFVFFVGWAVWGMETLSSCLILFCFLFIVVVSILMLGGLYDQDR